MAAVYTRLTLVIAVMCPFLCSLAAPIAASGLLSLPVVKLVGLDENGGRSGVLSAGGRHLQQISTPCPHQFGFDNFTNLEQTCPVVITLNETTNYPKTACCGALADMLCPYASLVNSPQSQCAQNYWSALELSTNLTQSFFDSICTDVTSPQGIPCPNDTVAASPPDSNQSSPVLGFHSFGLYLILAIGILEFLILCF